MARVLKFAASLIGSLALTVVSALLAIPWLYGMFKLATSKSLVLWQKVVSTSLVAFIPVFIIAGLAIYERCSTVNQK